ncbi:MAG: uroporphyrinogen-III C-methyltransferase [Lachnospiraceae bacterium]|nr:uroporphyrinogen-III C-methyltransferase [Lachnospiraceae bacterium]
MTGKVWLVGAGPGDPGLFTLKGKQVLDQADVVVYDALVGQGVLGMIPSAAKKINVGKRASNHIMAQEEINRVLLEEAMQGHRVVRLKGGDPFLFGRGGEELELLCEHQIPFEIIPGITSAVAVPAYNGIPVTHRDFCSSVHIVTGHKRKGEPYNIDFEALVKTKGTLVFLMGIGALEDICTGLMEAGMQPDMPAAVLQQGTTSGQKRIVATISTLKEETERQGVETPAIIVVGQVCILADKFGWYEKKPLAGSKILVTRPKELISAMSERLREQGAEVLELPAIRTEAIEPNPALENCLKRIEKYDWIVFTSPTGVRIFFEQMKGKCDIRRLAGARFAVIGKGTAKELGKWNISPDLMPEVFDGRNLGAALAKAAKPGEWILIPRAALGTEELTEELKRQELQELERQETKQQEHQPQKLQIEDIATYETRYEASELIDERAEIEAGRIDYAVFTSASTVKGFAEAAAGLDYSAVRAVCIGKQTQAAAEKLGMQTWVAKEATMDAVAELVEHLVRNGSGSL